VESNETVTIHCSLLRPTKFYWKILKYKYKF